MRKVWSSRAYLLYHRFFKKFRISHTTFAPDTTFAGVLKKNADFFGDEWVKKGDFPKFGKTTS